MMINLSIWVGSPRENAASPWGLFMMQLKMLTNHTWADGTAAAALDVIIKAIAYKLASKTGVVNVDQIKISTGDYENTLSNDFVERNTLNIYPNPADDIINVFSAGEFDVNLRFIMFLVKKFILTT